MARYQLRNHPIRDLRSVRPELAARHAAHAPEPEPEPVARRSLWFETKAALVAEAEARGIDATGTRAELIGRLGDG